jgi:peptidoglycan/xylan/chitin deacetylase (PgdA/CDA1 family)
MSWRTAVKVGLAGALVGSGVYRLVRRARAPRVHLLGYHRVAERVVADGPSNAALCVSTETFARQMRQLREEFEVLSLADAIDAIEGRRRLDRDACAITFDDGYRDVYLRAAPILDELALPAAVFVPSGYVGSSRLLTHDRLYAGLWPSARQATAGLVEDLIARLPGLALEELCTSMEMSRGEPRLDEGAQVMSPPELRALADAGWEIGGHTVGHVVLSHETPARVDEELTRSRRDLSRIAGRPCRYFAYCNGYHTPGLIEALRRAGYEGAVTTRDRPNRPFRADRFRLGRKVLWEGHARGLDGQWSSSVSAANLRDLFGALGLTRPVDGELVAEEVR